LHTPGETPFERAIPTRVEWDAGDSSVVITCFKGRGGCKYEDGLGPKLHARRRHPVWRCNSPEPAGVDATSTRMPSVKAQAAAQQLAASTYTLLSYR
jgi:hypothetical protein